MIDVLLGEDQAKSEDEEEDLTLHVLFRPTFGSFSTTRTRNMVDPLTLKCLEFL